MTLTTFHAKNTSNSISYQVRQILNQKGFSFLWNWDDFAHYRSQVKNEFNKAVAIAELFISNSDTQSDYDEYIN